MSATEQLRDAEELTKLELQAFRAVDFNWTRQLRSVWQDPAYHVPELHQKYVDEIIDDFQSRTLDLAPADEPLGRALIGAAGFGKTHLLGELRRRTWQQDSWFVLLDFSGVKDFWLTVALGFRSSLQVRMSCGQTQGEQLVRRLAKELEIGERLIPSAAGWRSYSHRTMLQLLQFFRDSLARKYAAAALGHLDAVTALILLNSDNVRCQEVADLWLQGDTLERAEAREFEFNERNDPQRAVRSLAWIMSRVAPTLIAVDQIDGIVTASKPPGAVNGASEEQQESQSIVHALAQGLLDLHEVKHRAVTVISSLESTWHILRTQSRVPVAARYTELALNAVDGPATARALVAARFKSTYARLGFAPASAEWPFTHGAFEAAAGMSPRELLMACYRHQQACVAASKVTLCERLFQPGAVPLGGEEEMDSLDQCYRSAFAKAAIEGMLDAEREEDFCNLLDQGLRLLEEHYDLPRDIDSQVQRDPDLERPALHGRLSFAFVEAGGREEHYCFRALAQGNAIAFQTRLRAAMTASGIDQALKFRRLFILRRDDQPSGPKTTELVDQFRKLGGQFLAPTDDDLRTLVALKQMAARSLKGFAPWLRKQKPLYKTQLFQAAGLCPPPFLSASPPGGSGPSAEPRTHSHSRNQAAGSISVGRREEGGVPGGEVKLSAALLPRHIAILAGSGSGKTVLLRRIVEEAVLLGIPAILLDPNNDLSRLGDSWPTPPQPWTEDDAGKAREYQARVDVVIWTPGVSAGNPMSLKLLPDFASVGDDEDERERAVQMALATLIPLAAGNGARARLRSGVLADTLRRFAASGGGELSKLIQLLSELPGGISKDPDCDRLGRELAAQLNAAVAIDPLLRARGEPLDPKKLFQGPSGKTRVSVINLAGLADDARDSFVNRLQISLFTFIKDNPSPSGMLYVVDEAQNFAPSDRSTACRASALALVAQARKYGLGMIFATQMPKGIHHNIVSNCATHVYGRMSSPAALESIRELMATKGGAADDVGSLTKGTFYFSTEYSAKPLKIRTPMCLSHHPAHPLTHEEVIQKARAKRP